MGERFGGRTKGTPNKSTAKVKAFLDDVFDQAFEDDGFRERLVNEITSLKIDTKLFATLLAYYAGRPAQAVDHTHSGTVTLAQLITGHLPADTPDGEDDGQE